MNVVMMIMFILYFLRFGRSGWYLRLVGNKMCFSSIDCWEEHANASRRELIFIRHYKIFCVNGNTGFRNESRIFYFIHLQNEEAYERKESSSA